MGVRKAIRYIRKICYTPERLLDGCLNSDLTSGVDTEQDFDKRICGIGAIQRRVVYCFVSFDDSAVCAWDERSRGYRRIIEPLDECGK